jgi:hypothetical protein
MNKLIGHLNPNWKNDPFTSALDAIPFILDPVSLVAAKLNVARMLQKQPEPIGSKGDELEMDAFLRLMDICNSDPAHVAKAKG